VTRPARTSFNCQLALADSAHAVVHPPGPQPRLRQRKALAWRAKQVIGGHAHIAQQDFAMPVLRKYSIPIGLAMTMGLRPNTVAP
jgi:hypothetical protein